MKRALGQLKRVGLVIRMDERSRMRGGKTECNMLRKNNQPCRNGDKVIKIMMVTNIYRGA